MGDNCCCYVEGYAVAKSGLTIFAEREVWMEVQVVRALGFPLELGWWGLGSRICGGAAYRNGFTILSIPVGD